MLLQSRQKKKKNESLLNMCIYIVIGMQQLMMSLVILFV